MKGWFEEYRCGCISPTVLTKRELLGYCPQHGEDRRGVFRDFGDTAFQTKPSPRPGDPPTGGAA